MKRSSLCHLVIFATVVVMSIFIDGSNVVEAGPSQGYQYIVNCCTSQLYVTESTTYARGPAQAGGYAEFSVDSSWEASVGVSIDLVEASVGFSVTQTLTRGGTCSYTPPNGVLGWVNTDAVFFVQYFDIYWHNSVTGKNTYQGGGSARQFQYFQCFHGNA